MRYEDKYPNLDFFDSALTSLRVHRLPSKYFLLKAPERKAHIVHETNVKGGSPWKTGTAICGTDTREEVEDDIFPVKHICDDCLKWLDQTMEKYLWDDENDEYYNPLAERDGLR